MKCHRSQNKKFLVSGNGICCTVSVEVGYQLKVNQKSGDLKSNLLGFYYPEKIRTCQSKFIDLPSFSRHYLKL